MGNSETLGDGRPVTVQSDSQGGTDKEYTDLLRAADNLIEHSRLGMYGAFIAPFSKQFKLGLRDAFPADQATYNETDRNEAKAIRDALEMRSLTFLVFVIWSCSLVIAVLRPTWLMASGAIGVWESVVAFALITGFAFVARSWIRHEYLSVIGSDATLFANYFFKELTNIHDRAINAVRASNNDLMLSSAWSDRSAGWIKIALWQGKRYENLDRFVTATAWRIESRYRIIERLFVTFKAIVLVGAIAGAAYFSWRGDWPKSHEDWAAIVAIAIYIVATLILWGVIKKASNAFWAERFRVSVVGFDEQKEHIHNQIANVVAGDKKLIMSDKRNVGEKRSG